METERVAESSTTTRMSRTETKHVAEVSMSMGIHETLTMETKRVALMLTSARIHRTPGMETERVAEALARETTRNIDTNPWNIEDGNRASSRGVVDDENVDNGNRASGIDVDVDKDPRDIGGRNRASSRGVDKRDHQECQRGSTKRRGWNVIE